MASADSAGPVPGRLGAQGDGEWAREGVQRRRRGRFAAVRTLAGAPSVLTQGGDETDLLGDVGLDTPLRGYSTSKDQ
ncbi:hypothetical protein C1I63_03855 [Rathayibacter caricis DSM 15933]|uniref:Uncharacterized protein n=1 Tax=Rathayibacter caricis DSM 15933 TaxID=1328867 RepID=A0A2T4URA5_9MICO|nr:hypothetical protein C1I63_03855 [Rathayibacter caricis DSM 15933]